MEVNNTSIYALPSYFLTYFLSFLPSFFFLLLLLLLHFLFSFTLGRANIKHAKAATDKKRAVLFLKLLREIKTAVRVGGTNMESNARLATAVQAARANNVPKVKIQAAMEPASADSTELVFEIMGPGGVGIIVQAEAESRAQVTPLIRYVCAPVFIFS